MGVTDLDVHLALIVAGDTRAFARWMAGAETNVRDSLRSFATGKNASMKTANVITRSRKNAP